MNTQTSSGETSQIRILEAIAKVALLLMYMLTFSGITLLVFARIEVMVSLAVAIASVTGGFALVGFLFGTSNGVRLLAARIMACTILPVLVILVITVIGSLKP